MVSRGLGEGALISASMSSGVQNTLLLLLWHSVGRLRPEITVARRPPFRCTPLRRAGHHRTLVLSTLWPTGQVVASQPSPSSGKTSEHDAVPMNL